MDADATSGAWIRRLQSGLILPTARIVLLVKAVLCFLIVVGGLCAAAFFEWQIVRPAPELSVPGPYSPPAAAIDMSVVDARFAPPKNIRFQSNSELISRSLTDQDVIGRLIADTPNKMADFPDDFAITGGKDAGLFHHVAGGLAPTQALLDKINGALPNLSKPERLAADLQVVARDDYGNSSAPTAVTVTLTYGPAPAAPAPPATPKPAAPQPTELEKIAHDIALIVDPDKTPKYFDAYEYAMRVPGRCGAGLRDDFVRNYGRALAHERTRLSAANIEAFYAGVCDAWGRVMATQASQRASVEAARIQAVARNSAARQQTAVEAFAAWAERNLALIVTGSALGVFLLVSLLLAFLAIENHSKAVREAVQALVSLEVARKDAGT